MKMVIYNIYIDEQAMFLFYMQSICVPLFIIGFKRLKTSESKVLEKGCQSV